MSGICGAWMFDGDPPEIGPIVANLERRGPDGTHHWTEGPVALGHTLLATTPEALVEVLPLTEPDSGCTITADARIDNRDELIAALDLGDETRTIGDGELILRAYLKWGEDCPKQLLGDFAFAIWDARVARLFCARDHMGLRQLIYHHAPGRLFAFANEPEALVVHARVPKRINEGRIADFLDNLEGLDLTSTFFEAVFRLPPAHTLIVDDRGLTLRRYWVLTPGPELKLDSDQAYADSFLAVFTEAVRCRLRSGGPVGSMLSGGMDSNSVAAVASRLLAAESRGPLITFSAVGPDPETCVETRAIQAALGVSAYTSHSVNHADLESHAGELARLTEESSEPFDGHMTLVRSVYLIAHRRAVKTVLDGAGGDVVLTAGNHVAQLLKAGNFRQAMREAQGDTLFWGRPPTTARKLLKSAWGAFVPRWMRDIRQRLIWGHDDRKLHLGHSIIASDFAKRVGLVERRARFRNILKGVETFGFEHRVHAVLHPHLVVGRERYDRVASSLAIEPRDPFLDIRVVEFCLSLPASQLQSGGWPKMILRRAMSNLLPSTVIWRRGKEHLGWAFTMALLKFWKSNATPSFTHEPQLVSLVNSASPMEHSQSTASEVDIQQETDLRYLSLWLARNKSTNESFSA